jgi:transcriptional antiterminator RfaH
LNNRKQAWYLVSTKTRSEQLAQENLNRQSYTTYLPLVKNKRRRNGRYLTRIEAFFPGYLFIQLDSETDNWSPIRSTRGVAGLVRFGGVPATIPEGLIESLKANEDNTGYQQIEHKQLKQGDSINIIDGPFAGQQGIFQTMKGNDRVLILLNIIGKNTPATLSIHNLQLAG